MLLMMMMLMMIFVFLILIITNYPLLHATTWKSPRPLDCLKIGLDQGGIGATTVIANHSIRGSIAYFVPVWRPWRWEGFWSGAQHIDVEQQLWLWNMTTYRRIQAPFFFPFDEVKMVRLEKIGFLHLGLDAGCGWSKRMFDD